MTTIFHHVLHEFPNVLGRNYLEDTHSSPILKSSPLAVKHPEKSIYLVHGSPALSKLRTNKFSADTSYADFSRGRQRQKSCLKIGDEGGSLPSVGLAGTLHQFFDLFVYMEPPNLPRGALMKCVFCLAHFSFPHITRVQLPT